MPGFRGHHALSMISERSKFLGFRSSNGFAPASMPVLVAAAGLFVRPSTAAEAPQGPNTTRLRAVASNGNVDLPGFLVLLVDLMVHS
jgi:hypothetical protein